MIKVFGRILCVPENEKELGFVADHLVETRQFRITDPSLFSFSFKLELENGSYADIVDLSPIKDGDALILTWEIANSHLRFEGPMQAQLRAFSENGAVWHSEITIFTVRKSISAESAFPAVLPTEFGEMECRMQKLFTDVQGASVEALDAVDSITSLSQSAEDAATLAEGAAMQSQTAASGASVSAESAQNAAASARNDAAYVLSVIGNIDTAIDSILALETSYIGGDAE